LVKVWHSRRNEKEGPKPLSRVSKNPQTVKIQKDIATDSDSLLPGEKVAKIFDF
jgi:hypothetical protein